MKKNLKVGYRNYNIKVLDSVMAKVNELHGQFLTSEGVIALSSAEDSVSHGNTFIHEILHAIIYQWGIELDEKEEEKICNILANGLTTVIVDNPWLLPYLQKHIGDKHGNNV